MLRPLQRYADFKGRSTRAELVMFGLFQGLITGVCLILGLVSLGNEDPQRALIGFTIGLGLAGLIAAALFIPTLAVFARRLHDAGLTAWFMLLLVPGYLSQFVLVGGLATAVSAGMAGDTDSAASLLIGGVVGSGGLSAIGGLCNMLLLGLSLLPGTRGPNRFGPDPRHGDPVPDSTPTFDDARLDALIAQAKADALAVPSSPPVIGSAAPVFGRRGAV